MSIQPIGLPESIAFGEGFELDLRPRRLRRGNRVLKLERIPLEILLLLLEHPEEIVTREKIVARVWGEDVFLDTDNSIRGAIRKIRYVLKDDPEQPQFIQTVTGQGYRFISPVIRRPQGNIEIPANPPNQTLAAEVTTEPGLPLPGLIDSQDGRGTGTTKSRWLVLVLGLGLVLAVALTLVIRGKLATDTKVPTIRSLAVLPLKNMSGDPTQEYFAEGMTEELIGRLAAIHELRVISRTSVMQFQNPRETTPEIGRMLGVDAIVEGSVTRDGNRIRVHAQLIRAANDEHFWSETYDRETGDVLTLESDIAQAIAEKVKVTVTGAEREHLNSAHPVAPEVYEAYLKGLSAEHKVEKTELDKSLGYFQDAIQRDPSFAPAYVGLGEAYSLLGSIYVGGSPNENRPKVLRAARKALELDPNLAQAHLLLADTEQQQWHWAVAEAEYRRALDLNPNDALAYTLMARWFQCQGRSDEALAYVRRAREMDPSTIPGTDVAWVLFIARHNDEAQRELKSVLAVNPDDPSALWDLGYVLIAIGKPNEAIPVLEKAALVSHRSPGVIGVLIRAYAHAGRKKDAFRLLAELNDRKRHGYVPAAAFVNAYLGLNDVDATFNALDQAYKEQSNILQWLKVHPHFDPIRNDPRFQKLLKRVGLS